MSNKLADAFDAITDSLRRTEQWADRVTQLHHRALRLTASGSGATSVELHTLALEAAEMHQANLAAILHQAAPLADGADPDDRPRGLPRQA